MPSPAAEMSPAAFCTPTAEAGFVQGASFTRSTVTAWSDSMGRVAAAGDNAAMESLFSLLQRNVLYWQRWDTREQLRIAIVTWIGAHLPSWAPLGPTRPVDPDRIRDHHVPSGPASCITSVTRSCSSPDKWVGLDIGACQLSPGPVRRPTLTGAS
ncbi:transposase [Nocardia brasiliensis ATCC 700358]|uniref:Transposase n=1 Tax=Nocardia brasiliensis (strain ATCC 700358 / HUJEG-1) TaxID=1133849 RepID=K0EHM4_NOCB7|nr:transposase [Nocardia brasiliensis ATCC 700358]